MNCKSFFARISRCFFTIFCPFRVGLVYLFVLCVCILLPRKDCEIVLGIPRIAFANQFDLFGMAKWFVLWGVFFLFQGIIFSRCTAIQLFSVVRVKKRLNTCYFAAFYCLGNDVLFSIILTIAAAITANAKPIGYFLLVLSSAAGWSFIACVFFCWSKTRKNASLFSLLIYGWMCVLGSQFPALKSFLPSFWGMYCVSSEIYSGGSSIASLVAKNMMLVVSSVLLLNIIGGKNGINSGYEC